MQTESVSVSCSSSSLLAAWLAETEPWAEAVKGQALLDQLCRTVSRFVVLPKHAAEAVALWVLHTYAFELRDITTYLGIESPEKRCGKTTLLIVLNALVHRPLLAANISSSAFFRVIHDKRPTLLIDEADSFVGGNDELRGILNSGYTRQNAYVLRATGLGSVGNGEGAAGTGGALGLAMYSSWCPKALAAIGRLPDTLADRCVAIRMQRKLADEPCERLRDLEPGPLRRQCARFVQDHREAIVSAKPEIPEGLNDRAADIWEPLLVLADLAGEGWPERAREAAVHLSAVAQENNPIGSLFLDILYRYALCRTDRLFSRSIVEYLNGLGARPWAESKRGKPVNEVWLARALRPYGVMPKTIWIEGNEGKGYQKEDFGDLFRRYIPRAEALARVAEAKEGLRAREERGAEGGGGAAESEGVQGIGEGGS